MSLIDTVAQDLPLKRYPAGQYVNGRWTESSGPTVTTLRAAVQVAQPNEVMNLPEAQRTKEAITLYAEVEMMPTNVEAGTRGDVVTYRGKEYEVQRAGLSEGFGLSVWKALAVRMNPNSR